MCLCAHYFPLTWLKAAVPRNKKCSCQGSGAGGRKCQCGSAKAAAAATTPEDETQPIFYEDLVARGLQVTAEPVNLEVPPPPAGSCCSAPAPAPAPAARMGGSCCSAPPNSHSPQRMPIPAPAPAPSSCCSAPAKAKSVSPSPPVTNGYDLPIKTEPVSAPFTPVQQFQTLPDFPVMKFSPLSNGAADHVCECGPTCNCVLCIDHPYNNATMNHIATEFGQMMSNGAQFSPNMGNGSPHPNGHGGVSRPEFYPPGWPSHNGMLPHDSSMMGSRQSYSPPQHATDMDIILNPADFQMFNFAFPPMDNGEQQFETTPMSMGMEPMPDLLDMNGFCGGAPDGCPCGDDCACIGCQIHKPTNGHDLASAVGDGMGTPGWR